MKFGDLAALGTLFNRHVGARGWAGLQRGNRSADQVVQGPRRGPLGRRA